MKKGSTLKHIENGRSTAIHLTFIPFIEKPCSIIQDIFDS